MAEKTTVLITGGNTGLGFEVVKALLNSERQYHILLAGRDFDKAQSAAKASTSDVQSNNTVEAIQVDVEDDNSISKAFQQVSSKHFKIDVLINNAGAAFDGMIKDGQMTVREAWNKAWNVNVTGAHIMTSTFLPLLLKSSDPRLLFITSGASSLEHESDQNNPRYKPAPAGLPKSVMAYKCTKTGLNMAMVEWTKQLKNDGVKVWAVAPGLLATGLGGNPQLLKSMGAWEPSVGGQSVLGVVEGKRDADVGKIVREYQTPVQPW